MVELNESFWRDRSVFVTGHTGFKGGWLTTWLLEMGARVATQVTEYMERTFE